MKKTLPFLALLLAPYTFSQTPTQDQTYDSEWVGAVTTELTIATGAVTLTARLNVFKIDTEGDAASDDLDTITQSATVQSILLITSENSARDVVLKDGTGNLNLGGTDITLGVSEDDWVELFYDGTEWNLYSTPQWLLDSHGTSISTNTTDIATNVSSISTLDTDKMEEYGNKGLMTVDPDNLNSPAMTADITLTNTTVDTAPGALSKGRQYVTSDADTWAVILPSSSTYPRFIWNKDSTNSVDIEISGSGTVQAVLEPDAIAYCEYILADAAWDIEVIEPYAKSNVITKSANYTIGTDTTEEMYGGYFRVTSAATITAPAVLDGMHFTIKTIGAIAVSADVNASDLQVLDGVVLDDGDKATNTSTAGDVITFVSLDDGTGWDSTSNSWTDDS